MNYYIAHILKSNADSIDIYDLQRDKNSNYRITNFNKLSSLEESDELFVFIPSSIVTSYGFQENKSLSKQINIANFISEVDSVFAEEVSSNKYFLHDNAGYVVDKNFLKNLNMSLSELNAQIHVLPEYLLNNIDGKDVITEFKDKFLFTYSNKTGFSSDYSSLDQYLEIVLNKNPNFSPLIFSSNKMLIDKFSEQPIKKSFNLNDFDLLKIKTLPNFFKLQISVSLIKKKIGFSKSQLILCLISLFLIIAGPNYLIYENNIKTKIYTSSTYNIFKAIDKDLNRVVAPRSQIDQIIKQLPQKDITLIKLPDLNIFLKYASKYIADISIDINSSYTSIIINSMPDLQFNILKNNAKRFNVTIIDDELISNDGFVSGTIKIGFDNE